MKPDKPDAKSQAAVCGHQCDDRDFDEAMRIANSIMVEYRETLIALAESEAVDRKTGHRK